MRLKIKREKDKDKERDTKRESRWQRIDRQTENER